MTALGNRVLGMTLVGPRVGRWTAALCVRVALCLPLALCVPLVLAACGSDHSKPVGGNAGSGGSDSTGGSGGAQAPSCPTSCDDGKSCTIDTAAGDASECTLTCSYDEITECADGDGCCPAGCLATTDSDCTETTAAAIPEDRRIDWQPGIPGGIPNRTEICTTIDAAQFGDGNTDATSEIQNALDDCPEGQVVHLPAGEYRLSDGLSIQHGVVLRGDGPAQTRLIVESGNFVVQIGSGAQNNIPGVDVVSGYTKGSTELVLADASDFEEGDVVLIDQLDDDDLVTTGNCTFFKRSNDGQRSLGQIFEIVSKNGNTIEISSPLYLTYSSGLAPQLSKTRPAGTVKFAGVEDLYATRTAQGGSFLFHLIDAAYSWLKNVHGEKVHGRAASLETCYRCVVRDSYFNDAWEITPGGHAYGITLDRHTSECLVENNIVRMLNIPIVFNVSSGGNVVAYNYIDDAVQVDVPGWNTAGIRGHCSYPYMELLEGNWTNQIAMDNIHGGSGYVTFYRNYLSSQRSSYESTANVIALALYANQLYMNALGNVLWTPDQEGSLENACGGGAVYLVGANGAGNCEPVDARVGETLLRHGNYDFISDDVHWDPAISDRNLPPSLYLKAKPAFFGDLPWPAVDPEAAEPLGTLPAKERYETEFAR